MSQPKSKLLSVVMFLFAKRGEIPDYICTIFLMCAAVCQREPEDCWALKVRRSNRKVQREGEVDVGQS